MRYRRIKEPNKCVGFVNGHDRHLIQLSTSASGEIRLKGKAATQQRQTKPSGARQVVKRQDAAHLVYSAHFQDYFALQSGHGRLPQKTKFTSKAKRSIREACGALKAKFGKRILFATLTLPGGTICAMRALAQWSGRLLELLKQWVRDTAPDSLQVSVWELQKRGALHLHMAIGTTGVRAARALEKRWKAYTYKLMLSLEKWSGVPIFERASGGTWKGNYKVFRSNCVPVRKCVKRYMSKYLSKAVEAPNHFAPSRWWSQSRALKHLAESLRGCVQLQIANWEVQEQALEVLTQLLLALSDRSYIVKNAYRPLDYHLIIYPREEACKGAFDDAVEVLRLLPYVQGTGRQAA